MKPKCHSNHYNCSKLFVQIDGQAEGLVDLKLNDPLCPSEAIPPAPQKQDFITVFSDSGYHTRAWQNTHLKMKNTETMHQSAFFQD